MPNIGQMVSIEPVQTSAPQPAVTRNVASHAPGQPIGLGKLRMQFAQRFLHQEPPDARAGVDRRQDEERLEHDREVVPVFQESVHRVGIDEPLGGVRENERHADGQRDRPARSATQAFAADEFLDSAEIAPFDGQMR